MAELLIIADDLTGAIEAGVQLSKHGIPAVVVIDSNTELKTQLINKNITALVVNAESRHLLPEEAADKISKVLDSAKDSGIKWYYKKTDSTMRGNIGSELEAFIRGTNQSVLPYIPAHPKLKRFTRDGYQYIDDNLLHQTSFARDPFEPVKSSFVPEILKNQSEIEIQFYKPTDTSSEDLAAENRKILVFNCNSEADLHSIGKIILKNGWHRAISGTAGFVEILPGLLPLGLSKINMETPGGSILFVNGSLNAVSLEQVNYAKENGVLTLFLTQNMISSPDFRNISDYKKIINKIRSEFKHGRDVIISTNDSIHPEIANDTIYRNYQSFSMQTGSIISAILNEVPITVLCVFGGDTLTGILKKSGGKYIETKNEILPGVSCTTADISSGTIYLLSKPGGYGDKDEILKIINHFKFSGK